MIPRTRLALVIVIALMLVDTWTRTGLAASERRGAPGYSSTPGTGATGSVPPPRLRSCNER